MNTTSKREASPPLLLESNKRLKKLILPKRVKRVVNEDITEKLNKIINTKIKNEQDYECTHCGEILYSPFPRSLERLIKAVRKNEKEYKIEQEIEYKKLVDQCKKEDRIAPPFIYLKGGISKNDQSFICRMHKVELIFKPMAIEKGYPKHIQFDQLNSRIKEFEKELKDIIDGKIESSFLKQVLDVHEKLGSVKARQPIELMKRFDQSLPGYYGNRGSHHMMETLEELFTKNDYLNKEKASPLTPVEYIQQILVPEVGTRLIKQDLNLIDLQEAHKIMKESSEYGSIVYNKLKK